MAPPRSATDTKILPIVVGLAFAFTITVVDPLVLNLNLPQVSRALHVPPHLIGLLGGTATLVMAAAVLAAGNLGDAFGLERLLTLGLIVVTVADLLSFFSPGFGFLLAMRALAGLGMAALLGGPLALLKTSVPESKRAAAIGMLMGVEMVLCGVTPALTGWVVTTAGWRFLFLLTPLLAAVSLVLTVRYVPEAARTERRRLDVGGISLFGMTLTTLVIGLAAAQNGITRPQTWLTLAISATAALLFVRHERRASEPALDLALFRSSGFCLALTAALTLNLLAAGLGFVLGQFGSTVLALSPEAIGLLYLPGTLLIAGAVVFAGRVVGKTTPWPVMVAGLLLLAASGFVLAATASPTMALWLLVAVVWLGNLGSLVTSVSVSEAVLAEAPPGHSGTVASTQLAFGMIGCAFGPTVYLLLFQFFFRQAWSADAEARGMAVTRAEQAVDAVRSGMALSPGTAYDPNLLRQTSGLELGLDVAGGLRLTMSTVSVLPLVVAMVTCLLPLRRSRRDRRPSPPRV